MSNHTPGPWQLKIEREDKSFCPKTGVERTPGAYFRVSASDFHTVHSCYANDALKSFAVSRVEADARLIAAAPLMLEALEYALGEVRESDCSCDGEYQDGRLVGHACYFHRIEHFLRSAVAKATGGDK